MAKRKRVEKIGNVIGSTRPIWGIVLFVIGVYLAMSVLGYHSGQDVLFKAYFEPLLPTTEVTGVNICGKLGATVALSAILVVGAAAYMLPVYVIWYAINCFRRRASLISRTELTATIVGVLALSVTAAVLQSLFGASAPTQSAAFPSSWGGKFGFAVFDFLRPFLDSAGSLMIFGAIYFVSLAIVFVDSPVTAISDMGKFLVFAFTIAGRVLKFVFYSVPRFMMGKRTSDQKEPKKDENQKPQPAVAEASAETPSAQDQSDVQITPDETARASELRDLADFARQLSSARNFDDESASVLVPVVEAQNQEYVDTRPEVAAVNFNGVQTRLGNSADSELDENRGDSLGGDSVSEEESAQAGAPESGYENAHEKPAADVVSSDGDGLQEGSHAAGGERAGAEQADDGLDYSESAVHSDDSGTLQEGDDSRVGGAENLAASVAVASSGSLKAPREKTPAGNPGKLEFEVTKIGGDDADYSDIPDARQAQAKKEYIFPSIDLLSAPQRPVNVPREDYAARMQEIIDILNNYDVKVIPDHAYSGPVITRYEVKPARGVKISKIEGLEKEITAGMKADKVRMIAPVPGHGTVGIEVPNRYRQNVSMAEVLRSKLWRETKYEIPIALGKDATGEPIVANLKKMTHALIAGSTNSGKSVCINTIIISMLYKMTPDDLRLIMIDPKMVELQGYNSIPHMLIPVVVDVKKAASALKWLTNEMMRRYKIFNHTGVRNIDGFNAKILRDKDEMRRAEEEFAQMTPEERQAAIAAKDESGPASDIEIPTEKLPYIVCIIDELADLMSVVGKDVEIYIARITQLARAAGIHMIIATQRPDVKVITGKIKNNLPTRIAFKVTSQIDSRTILDRKGAETLIGQGDMLFLNNGAPDIIRAQGAYIPDDEIEAVVEALKVNGPPQYAEDVQAEIDADSAEEGDEISEGEGGKYSDPMTVKAINAIRVSGKASTSLLQRKLGIGYGRAAKIIDELEERGLIGPADATGKRELFLDNL